MRTYIASPTGWQADDRPLWARLRRWAFTMAERELKNGRLDSQGARLPMAFVGERVIIKVGRFELATPWGMLVVNYEGRTIKQAFLAHRQPDMFGVHHIHTWLYGAPPAVTKVVENRAVA